jgi:hypothetical protein
MVTAGCRYTISRIRILQNFYTNFVTNNIWYTIHVEKYIFQRCKAPKENVRCLPKCMYM